MAPEHRLLTAEEFKALEPLAWQAARRVARQGPLVQRIFQIFVERGGPVRVDDLAAAAPGADGTALHRALDALDGDDIIRLRAGCIDVAYPFSAAPTAFRVRLPGGGDRHACCATDALGIAPMIGERVEITSPCRHCGDVLAFTAGPGGVGPDAGAVVVGFGARGGGAGKAFDGL
jgi:hypothetical protein